MNQHQATPRFIRLDEVASRLGLGKSTVLSWESLGKFPKAVRLSPTARVWLETDVNTWMVEQHSKTTIQGGGK
jgi:prophage regulatory protein